MKKNEIVKDENMDVCKGACKFCGQIATFNGDISWTYEEWNEMATEMCGCEEAKAYTARKEQKEVAAELILHLFPTKDGNGSTAQALLGRIADAVIEQRIKKATVQISGEVKATISLDKEGKIKVKKTTTHNEEMSA